MDQNKYSFLTPISHTNFLYIKFFNTKELEVLKKYKIGAYGANCFDLFYYKERLD